MRNSLKIIDHLPFCQSYTSNLTKHPLKCKTVVNNLGDTFYPRLAAIHRNIQEALILNNYNYLQSAVIPELSSELMRRKQVIKSQNIKLKPNQPIQKLLPLKNYFMPQTVYRTDNFYISVTCRVYFGGHHSIDHPFNWYANEKVFRFGLNRSLLWNTDLSFSQNLSSLRQNYILQFIVKFQSNYYINLYDLQNTNIYKPEKLDIRYDQDEFQDIVATEMVLRSGGEKFDWMVYDINGMLQNKSK